MGILYDDGMSQHDTLRRLFDSIDYSKAIPPRYEQPDDDDPRVADDDYKLSAKLKSMVDAMVMAAPGLDRVTAAHFLLHTPHGRALASHLNSISKTEKEQPMDIFKIVSITEDALMARAKLTKRADESEAKAFARFYENDLEYRKQWAALTETKHTLAKGMAHMTPTSTEVGNTNVSDDSAKAVRLLQEMADKQHRTFEQVFQDPANKALAARTYTQHHRSSVNTDYLER